MKQESKIQQDIIVYFRNKYCLKHHNPRYCIFSVPNESSYKNKNFRLTGVMSGVSDLIVLMPNRCIFVELKNKTGKQSPKQKEFQETVKNLGFEYLLIRSLEDFKKKLK